MCLLMHSAADIMHSICKLELNYNRNYSIILKPGMRQPAAGVRLVF